MPQKRKTKVQTIRPLINAHAAGADIGAREIYVAVPTELTDQPVRCFETFTQDLHSLVEWLQSHSVKTVAMEATSVYWIPLAELLEEAKIEVCLVNPRHVKNVPGRKTDVMDCQWLQYLHSVGLLRGAFRPAAEIRAVRALWRQRDALVRHSGWHIQHIHKALDQMNLQIHHVIADITGVSGMAFLHAILKGERDPTKLAVLGNDLLKATEKTLIKALTGDYRREHIFCLRQAHAGYLFITAQIAELDAEIEARLKAMAPAAPANPSPKKPIKEAVKRAGAAPALLERLFGVDLCEIPGFSAGTVHTLWAEIGPDLSAFPTSKHFCSWLSLCPDNKISGGKILSVATRPSSNRVAKALRIAAQALWRAKNELGEYYRRMRAKLGGAAAVTAVAHKLARIFYAVVKSKRSYDPTPHDTTSAIHRERTLFRLKSRAKELGFQMVPIPHNQASVS
jgi:transposase